MGDARGRPRRRRRPRAAVQRRARRSTRPCARGRRSASTPRWRRSATRVAAYAVSVDTPYAAGRFCRGTEIANLTALSDYRPQRSFGNAWGVLVEETGELCRAVFAVDRDGRVVHAEITPEIDDQPDYAAALAAVRAVV